MEEDEALYWRDGDRYVGTLLCQGGWDPNAQHGGTVQGLLARCIEQVASLVPMQVVRLTFDLVRPVPMGRPLTVEQRIEREGKKIQLVQLVLHDGGVEMARALALRLRQLDVSPDIPPPPLRRTPPPDDGVEVGREDWGARPGFLRGLELRKVDGEDGAGHAFWVRPRVPLVADEETSPLARLAMAGDFVNLIGAEFAFEGYTAINPDVSVQVLREPVGEWVAVVGTTRFWPAGGVGQSTAELRDTTGLLGQAMCSQLIQPR